ncbi:hypothetical protein F511_34481 [Dorcoceras hygrometricum]|uniref:Uncharacterized protein n=1 Tax=Dorcoceras hygrometricum TaxID=472368 RepID=A0A2Z7AG27_9LAMI|nr:hypothetical protein F511_34481 [Dorcoceras hygrometricum]
MKRWEIDKSGEGPAKKRENLGEKLLRVGKRGGQTTPVAPFCRPKESRLLSLAAAAARHGGDGGQQQVAEKRLSCVGDSNSFQVPRVSARKLAATLWELHQYKLPLEKMNHPRLRRLNHQRHQQFYREKAGLEPPDPSPGLPDMPESSSSLKKHVAATLMQHHRSIERSNHALQPVSPASYGSSMELAPHNLAFTPTSSIELKGRTVETSYSLKTSTELLKVLNRIWSLEEQHVSNVFLIKALKKELEHSRSRIKDLMRAQQTDHREIDDLVKQIAEDKLIRKNKEQDRINATVQSLRDELEDERKLRKRSESLHRKLAHELCDVKTTLASVSKELEKERKSCNLLEDLCDEFAWGIRDYEKELHALRQKSDKSWDERGDRNLILHISESWLDERVQMKLKQQHGLGEKKSVVDKLRTEIEALIQMKKDRSHKIDGSKVSRDPKFRRNSLESIPLNLAVSAPQDEDDDGDSVDSDSNCFELEKTSESNLKSQENGYPKNGNDEKTKQKQVKRTLGSFESETGLNPTSLQVKFEEQTAQVMSHGEKIHHVVNAEHSVAENSVESAKGNSSDRKHESEGMAGLNTNYMIDNLIRNHYLLSEGGNVQSDQEYGVTSVWRSHPSPVRQWTEKLPSHDMNLNESSSNLRKDLKENTLKAKLFEARTRGQLSRSRLKASIFPSINK